MKPIADRESEVSLLEKAVESAASGHGSTVFISGEAGMGKSALCDVASEIASEKGFEVLKGWCFPEYLKPYLPVESALRPLGISHLFQMSAPPKVERIFLISKAGILLSSVGEENDAIDDDIFTGMLSAVGHFVRDSMEAMAGEGSLDVLGYGGMRIIMEKGDLCSIAAVISGKENEYLINDLKEALRRVHEEYGELLDGDASMDELEGTSSILRDIIESGRYEGAVADDPKLRMGSIMDNVTMALVRKSGERPILLMIEDLQWADSATLALLHYLSRNMRESRIMLIGTYRPEEMGKARETVERMLEEGLADVMELGPIPEMELRSWLMRSLGDAGPDIAEHIVSISGGNPMFATEMLNMVLENLEKGVNPGEMRIPKRIQAMISAKLERLSEEDREILEAASVIGQQFTSVTIASMLEKRKILVLKSLKRMQEAGIIEESGGKYRFRNPTTRKMIYDEMGGELAQAYHELAAQAIENSEEPDHAALGYHYYMAGMADKALPSLFIAADEAIENYSNDEAIRILGHILELTEKGWDGERFEALRRLAKVHMNTGDYEKAVMVLREAENLAGDEVSSILRMMGESLRQMGDYSGALEELEKAEAGADEREKAMILLVRGNTFYRQGDYDSAMSSLEEALSIMEGLGDMGKDVATVMRSMGNIYFSRGEHEKALETYERSLNTDDSDLSGKAMSLNNMGVVNIRMGNYEKAAEYFRQALRIREKIGDRWGVAMFLSNLGVVLSESGDYEGAMEHFTRSLEIRERIGDRWGAAMSLNNIGLVHLEMGNYMDAVKHFKRALEIRESIGDTDGIAASLSTMAMAHAEMGDVELAIELYEKALKMEEEIGDRDGSAEILAGMGKAYSIAGEHDKAMEILERSESIFRELGNRKMLAYVLCARADVLLETGRTDDAERLIEELSSTISGLRAREMDACLLRVRGMLEQMKGRDGIPYLKESIELLREMGRKGDLAKTLYWLGKLGKDDKSMEEALSIFRECGMRPWIERS